MKSVFSLNWRNKLKLGTTNMPSVMQIVVQSNLAIRNGLIRNKLVLRNHFLWPICHLLYKDRELLALRNNFRVTKKFLIAKFDCSKSTSTYFDQCMLWDPTKKGQQALHLYSVANFVSSCLKWLQMILTANILESGPKPTPWKFLDSPPVIPSC